MLQALHSIFEGSKRLRRVEVCISNNCSDENYEEVELLIGGYPCIKYFKQVRRISLDENMHSCVKMASGEYIYYLGDDDFFLDDGVEKLLDIIDREHPDLVVLNALNVDKSGVPIGRLFPCSDMVMDSFNQAYDFYNDKCNFGTVLVKRRYLNDSIFEKFYGTSHAYMCFWASLAIYAQENLAKSIKVVTPNEPIVALGQHNKTYNDYLLDVFYKHIPQWFLIFKEFIYKDEMKQVVFNCDKRNYDLILSLRFLIMLKGIGVDVKKIGTYASARKSHYLPLKLGLVMLVPNSIFISLRFAKHLVQTYCYLVNKFTARILPG